VKSYQDLVVWQKAMTLAEATYQSTRSFPREELYGLTSQMRRAAVSVPSNIAEGQGRNSTREFLHHLSIALGSLLELETQVLLAARLALLNPDASRELLQQTAEVGRLIHGLSNALSKKPAGP